MLGRVYSYINSAKKILDQYSGEEPFSLFIKNFFRQNKKYGSSDRKQITNLCYCFFRLGKAARDLPFEERILLSLFLCSQESNEILNELKPEFNEKINLSLDEKLAIGNRQWAIGNRQLAMGDIFPWQDQLSKEIDKKAFILSHLQQPSLFLRLRPGHEEAVKNKLSKAGIPFDVIDGFCLELPNSSKLDEVIELDTEVVIQDYNSQQTGELIKTALPDHFKDKTKQVSVWDCCAGSGGKSILAYDLIPNITLTVSDIRESILINLKKRFQKAGIKKLKSFVDDFSTHHFLLTTHQYDLIILDAPCTGSGTWSRTPEQLYYFKTEKIDYYSSVQKKIASNVIPYLTEDGALVYITCSVFKEENEDIAEYIQKEFQLKLNKTQLLKGYDKNADSMFGAVFKKC